MTETIIVTVAPGARVVVDPHPANIPGLPPLELVAGETLRVTPERAAELLSRRLICDPATGAPVPPPPLPSYSADAAAAARVTVSYNGAPPVAGDAVMFMQPSWAAVADMNPKEPAKPAPWSPDPYATLRPGRSTADDGITGADGRSWPGF